MFFLRHRGGVSLRVLFIASAAALIIGAGVLAGHALAAEPATDLILPPNA
jgi:hypothetical protein